MSSAENRLATVTPLPGFARMLPDQEVLDAGVASILPSHEMTIDDVTVGNEQHFDGGVHIDRRYRMSNGTVFNSRLTLPRGAEHDILLSHRTPWCTDLNGLYTYVDELHAREGSVSVRVSPQQNRLGRVTMDLASVLFSPSVMLAHDAYAQHLILDDIDSLGVTKPKEIIDTGDSRAAMTNLAVQAYGPEFKRSVPFSTIVDPCIEHAMRPSIPSPRKIGKLAVYFGVTEPKELLSAIQEYDKDELRVLAKTARFSPAFWLHQVVTGYALFGGAAGGFVDHIPSSSVTALRLYEDSQLNHASDWRRRLNSFAGIHAYSRPGSHMSIVRMSEQKQTVAQVSLAQNQLSSGAVQPHELEAAMIVAGAGVKVMPVALSAQ